LLFIVLASHLYIGAANVLDHRISHGFPYGYMASDAFWDYNLAEWIQESGNYKYEPFYRCGGFDDCIGFMTPVWYHSAAIFSNVSGVPVYDAMYLLVFVFASFSILILYLILRKFNKEIAILSLPLTLFIYKPFFSIAFTWGYWDLIIMTVFLLGFIWSLLNIELKNIHLIIGFFVAGIFMVHVVEIVYVMIISLIFLMVYLIKRKKLNLIKRSTKTLFISAIISTMISLYFILIIFKVWIGSNKDRVLPALFSVLETRWHDAVLLNFRYTLPLILVGMAIGIGLLSKNNNFVIIVGYFMFLAGVSNMIGFSFAFHTRYFWPIYLSIFFGIALYFIVILILKKIVKNWRMDYTILISILLLLIVGSSVFQKSGSDGLMNSYRWEHINWIRENTDDDAKIFFFYGDVYSQTALLWSTKRLTYLINTQDYVNSINEKEIKRNYSAWISGPSDVGYAYGDIFSIKFHSKEVDSSYFSRPFDVCNFDYYVFEKYSREEILAKFNIIVGQELMKNEWMQIVLNNDLGFIIKNNQPGKECLHQGGVKIE